MTDFLKRLARRVRSEGLSGTLAFAHQRLVDRFWDWRLGVSTCDRYTSDKLGFRTTEYQMYVPTDYTSIRAIMKQVQIKAGKDVFMDYGCGLGRVLLMAAMYPFQRVLGLELSPLLAEQAKHNIRRCRARMRCKQIEVIQADATIFTPPPDVTFMYFFSPFGPSVLPKVLDRIRDSLEVHPRRIVIIYKNPPYFENEARGRSWLIREGEYRGCIKDRYAIYSASTGRIGSG